MSKEAPMVGQHPLQLRDFMQNPVEAEFPSRSEGPLSNRNGPLSRVSRYGEDWTTTASPRCGSERERGLGPGWRMLCEVTRYIRGRCDTARTVMRSEVRAAISSRRARGLRTIACGVRGIIRPGKRVL